MSRSGTLFIVSAPSGAGKTTLCEELIKTLPEVVRSVSMTTRAKRGGEVHGRDYFFVTEKQFRAKIKKNAFLEHAKVFGNYYGTPRLFVERMLRKGRDVVLTIDVQGAMKVRRNFRNKAAFIFILPPSFSELKNRLLKRSTEDHAQMALRLEIARKELACAQDYDFQVVNDTIQSAFQKLMAIVIATRCKTAREPRGGGKRRCG
ncbi:MAG: guanylate kinase [Candidatus Omnitrophica bacterium]|nr:guanylate kinase [Candidatus Omnitrophota bacterium]